MYCFVKNTFNSVVDGSCAYYDTKEIVNVASDSNEQYPFGIEEDNRTIIKQARYRFVSYYAAEDISQKTAAPFLEKSAVTGASY
jgi:hypothetical protein